MAAVRADRRRVLILGGTGEAAALARALVAEPGIRVITSLAGRTRAPAGLPGEVRSGGFGGPEGLAAYLADHAIDLVVDATHPFAAVISRHAAEASAAAGIPCLALVRPPWTPEADERWIEAADMAAAASAVARHGTRVFLTVGRQDLSAFADLPDVWFLVRTIEPLAAPPPLARCETLLGRGPFPEDEEAALLRARRIDLLVSKNSGGAATYGKIAAARRLGVPVVMVARPPLPEGARVETMEDALAWIAARFA